MFLAPSGTVQKLCGQSWGFYCIFFFLVGTPYDDIDYKTLTFGCGCQALNFIFKPVSNQRPVFNIPHPLILIFDKPNQLGLLDWSAVSFNYYYSLTLRITGGSDLVCLLSICPHSYLLFHLDFVAAVVFALVTVFGTNCLDSLSLWHCSFSNWIINSSMIWVITAKSCAYIQNRRNDNCMRIRRHTTSQKALDFKTP